MISLTGICIIVILYDLFSCSIQIKLEHMNKYGSLVIISSMTQEHW